MDEVLDTEIEHRGERRTLRAWLESSCVEWKYALLRFSAGWPLEKILTKPLMHYPTHHPGKHSRWRGVTYHEAAKLWYARMKVSGEFREIGYFKDELEAATAYNWAARRQRGTSAIVNER